MKDWDLLMDYTILRSECATWICWGVLECAVVIGNNSGVDVDYLD